MKEFFSVLKDNPLFKGICQEDFVKMLECMKAKITTYDKGQIVLLAGSKADTIGIVLEGTAQVTKADSEGKQSILTELKVGQIFGEVFACAQVECSPVTVIATQGVKALHLNYSNAIQSCHSACSFHLRLIENMLALLASKNLMLNQKIELLSKRTTRQRVITFLRQQSKDKGQINIPFSREQLADYLCVERSALCAEISKMQKDGLIKCDKRSFTLLQ